MLSWLRQPRGEEPPAYKRLLNVLLAALIVCAFFLASLNRIAYRLNFAFLQDYRFRLGRAFELTLLISLLSMLGALLVGAVTALLYRSSWLVPRYLARGYIKVIRGTPLMMQIYLFFYIVGTAWQVDDRLIAGVLILSSFEGAYVAEILRGSYESLDPLQLEAARAVGFNRRQTLRHVILPQMVSRTLPALTGQFASIVKDSSLLSLISLIELTQATREMTAEHFKLFEAYFLLGLLYLVMTLPLNALSGWLERRYSF